MVIGKVVSSVISTSKYKELMGLKFLIIQPYFNSKKECFAAVDLTGAGLGQIVLVTVGEPAQDALQKKVPVDAVVVGILDSEPVF